MKLTDRIRTIQEGRDYAAFARRWRAFVNAGRTAGPDEIYPLIQAGNATHRELMRAATDHAKAQVRNPDTLTATQADQLVIEARVCAERAMRKLLPELAEYVDFVGRVVAARSHQHQEQPPTPMEA